jgi:hypothetical protein
VSRTMTVPVHKNQFIVHLNWWTGSRSLELNWYPGSNSIEPNWNRFISSRELNWTGTVTVLAVSARVAVMSLVIFTIHASALAHSTRRDKFHFSDCSEHFLIIQNTSWLFSKRVIFIGKICEKDKPLLENGLELRQKFHPGSRFLVYFQFGTSQLSSPFRRCYRIRKAFIN